MPRSGGSRSPTSAPKTAGRAGCCSAPSIAIELAVVGLTVLINQWNARFYNALQDRNWDNFVSELLFFCVLAAVYIVLRVYQLYLNQWLQIRWRRWMTQRYIGHWLDGANHYRMQMLGDAADNPDQRIAEDIRQFIDGSNGVGILPIGLGLLSAIVTLVSFVIILWGLSRRRRSRSTAATIPGYLVWAALGYAVVGTLFTHLIGRPLIAAQFQSAALRGGFPLQSGAGAREFRTDRAAARRDRRARPADGPVRRRDGQLAPHHDAAEAAHLPDSELQPGLGGLSHRRGEPGLFRRRASSSAR